MTRRETPKEMQVRVVTLRKQGTTYNDIVKQTKLSKRTVVKFCLRAGLRKKSQFLKPVLSIKEFAKLCYRCGMKKTVFDTKTCMCVECHATAQATAGKVART